MLALAQLHLIALQLVSKDTPCHVMATFPIVFLLVFFSCMLQIAAQMPSADGILEREVLTLRPSILAVFLARNKAHVLPYFLGYFEHQRYPKDRISVW